LKNNSIEIKGAREHNLKNVSVDIPRDKLIVITGLSGSGKSSLAFDTLFAEGQRRYVESLSAYARQFLGKISKPDVDEITGIPPAIAIEQKINTANPRSTVGTSTEIYEYIKLLYARIGKTFSPISNKIVKKHNVNDVIDFLKSQNVDSEFLLLSPVNVNSEISTKEYLSTLLHQGYSRIMTNGKIEKIDNVINSKYKINDIRILIDKFKIQDSESFYNQTADSIQTAFYEGNGTCIIMNSTNETEHLFSKNFEADGICFSEPSVHMFSFNNPIGACATCDGFGQTIGINEDLVIPNKSLSIYQDAIVCWKGESMSEWKNNFIAAANKFKFPIHKPYNNLTTEQKELIWTGNKYFNGLNSFFKFLEENLYKIQYRVMLSRYRGKTICPTCKGSRLKKEASYVKINNKSINELVLLPISVLGDFFNNLQLTDNEIDISKRILFEIKSRLAFLNEVGLGYLSLNRNSSTLSGGESQRINLSTSLGSSLVGSLYILDEPSIGLHPVDNNKLINVLKGLRDIGNTVVIVEHDEEIMCAADYIIDLGPEAGSNGGEITFKGNFNELLLSTNSITADYLTGKKYIDLPIQRRKWNNYIEVFGARENNLKNINVKIPLNVFNVITGVSGSGKSSFVKKVLLPALNRHFNNSFYEKLGSYDNILGDLHLLKNVEYIDQNPIGKSSRSNPVTYIKAYDEIRTLFANQQLSKQNGFKPSHFSFNVDGGRCDECQGEGSIKVEMQFMADINLICDSCNGKRFKPEILEVSYNSKNIFEILELTVDDAINFFSIKNGSTEYKIIEKLKVLQNVGLGYIKLGQSSSTLSGGESQRLKLATFLDRASTNKTLFIFDEPTTGLHFNDIKKLLDALNALIINGNTVLVIEHNLDVVKCADWIIDLGPGGGDNGGNIVFEGTPEEIVLAKQSETGKYLIKKIKAH